MKTICYADVFDFPFKEEEIYRFLLEKSKIKHQESKLHIKIQKLIEAEEIEERNGFYFLKGREKIVKLRRKREKEARKKIKIAERVARFLKLIPFVKMVAVTGGLGIGNAKPEDDIDLLIVSQKGKIWTTRFLATILAELFLKRRRPGDKEIADKICLNMFLDEDHLAVPKNERDLFTAHEVVQLKVLWDRDDTYQKFLVANQWVERFLPNAVRRQKAQSEERKAVTKSSKLQNKKLLALSCSFEFCTLSFTLVEKVLRHFQLLYMRNRRTTEAISDGIIRFHPKDARVWVFKEYQKRIASILKLKM